MKVFMRMLLGIAMLAIVGCENSLIDRSLIFSTHTNFGLDVSVNPAETAAPAKIQIGYQRTEGVLNPVFYNHAKACDKVECKDVPKNVNDYYRAQAYSVIAKFEGSASGGGNASSSFSTPQTAATQPGTASANATTATATGSMSSSVNGGMTLSQWFATGLAAEILAAKGGASALTDNPGVAAAAANAPDSVIAKTLIMGPTEQQISILKRLDAAVAVDKKLGKEIKLGSVTYAKDSPVKEYARDLALSKYGNTYGNIRLGPVDVLEKFTTEVENASNP